MTWANCFPTLDRNPLTCKMLIAVKIVRTQGKQPRKCLKRSAMSVPSPPLSFPTTSGFNPYWGQTLSFRVLVPELALLRFVVKDYNWKSRNDFIGQYTVPWTCMQQGGAVLQPLATTTRALAALLMPSSCPSPGYRHIHLLSKDGISLHPASIFVNISIREGLEGDES